MRLRSSKIETDYDFELEFDQLQREKRGYSQIKNSYKSNAQQFLSDMQERIDRDTKTLLNINPKLYWALTDKILKSKSRQRASPSSNSGDYCSKGLESENKYEKSKTEPRQPASPNSSSRGNCSNVLESKDNYGRRRQNDGRPKHANYENFRKNNPMQNQADKNASNARFVCRNCHASISMTRHDHNSLCQNCRSAYYANRKIFSHLLNKNDKLECFTCRKEFFLTSFQSEILHSYGKFASCMMCYQEGTPSACRNSSSNLPLTSRKRGFEHSRRNAISCREASSEKKYKNGAVAGGDISYDDVRGKQNYMNNSTRSYISSGEVSGEKQHKNGRSIIRGKSSNNVRGNKFCKDYSGFGGDIFSSEARGNKICKNGRSIGEDVSLLAVRENKDHKNNKSMARVITSREGYTEEHDELRDRKIRELPDDASIESDEAESSQALPVITQSLKASDKYSVSSILGF